MQLVIHVQVKQVADYRENTAALAIITLCSHYYQHNAHSVYTQTPTNLQLIQLCQAVAIIRNVAYRDASEEGLGFFVKTWFLASSLSSLGSLVSLHVSSLGGINMQGKDTSERNVDTVYGQLDVSIVLLSLQWSETFKQMSCQGLNAKSVSV